MYLDWSSNDFGCYYHGLGSDAMVLVQITREKFELQILHIRNAYRVTLVISYSPNLDLHV